MLLYWVEERGGVCLLLAWSGIGEEALPWLLAIDSIVTIGLSSFRTVDARLSGRPICSRQCCTVPAVPTMAPRADSLNGGTVETYSSPAEA